MEAPPSCPPGNLQGALTGVAAATLAIAVTTVALRLFVRARLLRALGWDDACITLALVSWSRCFIASQPHKDSLA